MRRWLDSLGRDWQPLFVNLLLGLLFLLYWLGVYLMENIQPSGEAPLFWQLFASVLFFLGPLTDIVTSLQDYMSWRVLRHFLPPGRRYLPGLHDGRRGWSSNCMISLRPLRRRAS